MNRYEQAIKQMERERGVLQPAGDRWFYHHPQAIKDHVQAADNICDAVLGGPFVGLVDAALGGVLDESIAYLAGPMDDAEDRGVVWRRYLIEQCQERGLGVLFFDPTNKIKGLSVMDEHESVINHRKNRNWKEMTKVVSSFRREDLRMVDYSDFVIAYINMDNHTCGTYNEIFSAEWEHKPILAIVNGGIDRMPVWLFDVIREEEVFSDVDECVDYLEKIDKGEIELDDRWVLIRQYLTLGGRRGSSRS